MVGGALFQFLKPGVDRSDEFTLIDDGTAIQRKGSSEPFIIAKDLPDSVPQQFAHSVYQRFDNRRFHFISVSPSQEYIAFASGEGDQWMGMINTTQKYLKFLIFGIQTTFLGATWSPDNKFLAFSFWGPDRRLLVYITTPPAQMDPKPTYLNVWFKLYDRRPQFKSLGWEESGDTTYNFSISDDTGKEVDNVKMPLYFNANKIPEHMKKGVGQ